MDIRGGKYDNITGRPAFRRLVSNIRKLHQSEAKLARRLKQNPPKQLVFLWHFLKTSITVNDVILSISSQFIKFLQPLVHKSELWQRLSVQAVLEHSGYSHRFQVAG